jgi:hypothetical protein
MENWKNVKFSSSTALTQQFSTFAKKFKAHVKKLLEQEGLELTKFNRGHFEVSGFIHNPKTDQYAFFSIADVRFFTNEWHERVLIRSATNIEDFEGGSNNLVRLNDIGEKASSLTV